MPRFLSLRGLLGFCLTLALVLDAKPTAAPLPRWVCGPYFPVPSGEPTYVLPFPLGRTQRLKSIRYGLSRDPGALAGWLIEQEDEGLGVWLEALEETANKETTCHEFNWD